MFSKKTSISSVFLKGHIESRFHNPAGKTPTEKVSLSIPNLWKKLWFWDFFPKRFLWTRRMQFRHIFVKTSVPEGPKDFAQCTKAKKGTYKNSQENFFPQNVLPDTKTALLTTPPKKLPTKAESVRSLCEYGNTQIFCSKKLSLKLFLWTRIRQFWKPRWKYFVKRPKLSVHSSKKMENFSFFDLFLSSKFFYKHVACIFDNPLEKKLPEPWKKQSKSQNNEQNIESSRKNFLWKRFRGQVLLQFWRFSRKYFDKKATSFGTMSKDGIFFKKCRRFHQFFPTDM